MGLGYSQYIYYSITAVYMHISLIKPQCILLWPHKFSDGPNFEFDQNLARPRIYVAITGYTVDSSGKYAYTIQ